MDSNVEISAPVVGIGSCLRSMTEAMGNTPKFGKDWLERISQRKQINLERMSARLNSNTTQWITTARWAPLKQLLKTIELILVNEGANTLDYASIIDIFRPRKRLDVGTWGVMGIGMGAAIAAAFELITRFLLLRAIAFGCGDGN